MTAPLIVNVFGTPAPQGSHKGYVVNGRAVVTHDSKRTRPWRQDVKHAALDCLSQLAEDTAGLAWPYPLTGAIDVDIRFYLPRPKSHYRTGKSTAHLLRDGAPDRPVTKPDIDKLLRSTCDALTEAGVYGDDSQVVGITTGKWFADHRPPGAQITIRRSKVQSAPLRPVEDASVQEALL